MSPDFLWASDLNIASSLFKPVDNPLVKALAGLCRCGRNLAVKIRWKTEVEFAGIWLIRIYGSLLAVFEIFINYGMKAFYSFGNRLAVETDYITSIYNPADKNAVIEVRFNPGNISLIGNCIHGISPVRINNSLISLTAYRFNSFCGWGLCILIDSPFRSIRTLEPSPYWISPPRPLISEATAHHSSPVGAGFLNMAASVLRCFVFTIRRYYSMVLLSSRKLKAKNKKGGERQGSWAQRGSANNLYYVPGFPRISGAVRDRGSGVGSGNP